MMGGQNIVKLPGDEMSRVVFLHESAQFTHHPLLTVGEHREREMN